MRHLRHGAVALASVGLLVGCGGADGQADRGGDEGTAYCVDEYNEVVDDSNCGDVGSALGGG